MKSAALCFLSLAAGQSSLAAGQQLAAEPSLAAEQPPHIVFVLTDDLGWNSAFHNDEQLTPTLDELASTGLVLTSHYTYKYCAPTRGSVLTGRFPFKLTAPEHNFIPWWLPVGTNLSYTMLPAKLKQAKYATHHIGKVSTDIVLTPDSYK